MHKKKFIVWYYTDGLKNIIQTIKDLLQFIAHFFSFKLLTESLFYRWKKNILLKEWQDFNLFLFLKYWWLNFWLRLVGFFIRSLALILGGLAYVLVSFFGLLFIIYYFTFPAIVSLAIAMCFSSLVIFGVIVLLIQFFYIFLVYKKFDLFDHKPYQKMSLTELNKQNWFYRIFERLGVKKEDVSTEILDNFEKFDKFLNSLNVTRDECEKIIHWEIKKQNERERQRKFFSKEKLQKIRPIGLNWQFGETAILDDFADDLTEQKNHSYSDFPFVGYSEELNILKEILSRQSENNVLIVGQKGSGRRRLIYEIAQRIKNDEQSQNTRILQFNCKQLEQQIKKNKSNPQLFLDQLFQEVVLAGNVILVIDDLEKCLNISNHDFSFSEILSQYAQFPTLRIIGIASEDNFEKNQATWLDNFEIVYLSEMNKEEAMQVLFEHFYGEKHTQFTFQILRKIITESEKIYPNLPLPLRAINLTQEILTVWKKEREEGFITPEFVNIFTGKKKVSEKQNFSRKEKEIFSLENNFYEKMVGQDLAINSLVGAIRKMRDEQHLNKFYSFLFLGSAGTGKSKMAKVFSEQYFGKEKVVEFDVADFLKNTQEKWFGSQAKDKKSLLDKLKKTKNYVVLFKNLDKASSDFLAIFSSVLQKGFFKDDFQEKVDFRNLILIATFDAEFLLMKDLVEKNLGLNEMKEKIARRFSQRTIFTWNFLAKFNEMILFFPLNRDEVFQMAEILLNQFSVDFQEKNQVEVYFSEKVIEKIVENGYDENLGARSLESYIETEVNNFLVDKIIREKIQRGSCVYFGAEDMK